MSRTTRRLLLLVPLIFSSAAAQQDANPPGEEQQEIRRYTVEMIVFKYNENVSIGSEVFVPDPPPPEEILSDEPYFGNLDDLDNRDEVDEVKVVDRRKYELVRLPENEFSMNEIYGHLERLDVYEPLLHFGWTQPTFPEEQALVRPLSSFVTPRASLGLEGDLKLYLGRYLHLVVDLKMDAPATNNRAPASTSASYGSYEIAAEQPVHYRIQEDRIFRSGEVRYFDHPKFGVLAKITRFEEPDTAEPDDEFLGETELLGLDGE
ncbi:MAG: CsiV family protein [Pseudomonadota bacterium]